MLGILTGFPNQACDVLKAMKDDSKGIGDVYEFVSKLKTRKVRKKRNTPESVPAVYYNIARSDISETERGTWDRLADMLEKKMIELELDSSLEPYEEWASLVSRFSFQYGRVSEHNTDESEEEGSSKL